MDRAIVMTKQDATKVLFPARAIGYISNPDMIVVLLPENAITPDWVERGDGLRSRYVTVHGQPDMLWVKIKDNRKGVKVGEDLTELLEITF